MAPLKCRFLEGREVKIYCGCLADIMVVGV